MKNISAHTHASEWPQIDARAAYDGYQRWRHRCPQIDSVSGEGNGRVVPGLLDLVDEIDVFVFDAFGVLNTGDQVIDNAAATVTALREHGKRVYVLSNGASNDRSGSLKKLGNMGFDFSREELLSSRDVCEVALPNFPSQWRWGVIGRDDFMPDQLTVDSVLLADEKDHYDAVDAFLFLSTAHWSAARQALLDASLAARLRTLVVANPDIVAPFPSGFSIEPGYFAHMMADRHGLVCDNLTDAIMPAARHDLVEPVVRFFGKPFVDVYATMTDDIAAQGVTNISRICMVGDTLHTDILGGNAAGWRTALVTDYGLFATLDAEQCIRDCGIVPDWIMPSIG